MMLSEHERDRIRITYEEITRPHASAHDALRFAFGYDAEQFPPSVVARMIQGNPIGNGKGLVGMAGAGQAGMILAEIHDLGEMAEHFLAARFATRGTVCHCRRRCCSGMTWSNTFREAVKFVGEAALSQLSGHQVNQTLRIGLVLRYFGAAGAGNMTELAKEAKVSRDMAAEHNAKLLPWLKHEEGKAMHAAIVRLKERGFVE